MPIRLRSLVRFCYIMPAMRSFFRRGDVRLAILLGILISLAVVLYIRSDGLKLSLHFGSKAQPGYYKVEQFIDGDTIAVDMNGNTEIIRFIGVDTPETHRPNTPVQCYGTNAASYTKSLIGTHPVRLEADPLNTNRDRYSRLLRYVYLPDGTLVESRLISEGYGFAYTSFPMVKANDFERLEATAKKVGRGLWSACEITTLPNGIRQTGPVN